MKQSLARTFLLISLILSLISFILSLIAYYLPNWKSIQLRSSFTPIASADNNPMDPLVRGEVEKYIDILYRRGETHSFGLLTHCINGNECGRNYLPSFEEKYYGLCHNINSHRQCITSNQLLTTNDQKCTCQQPSYVKIIHKSLIFLIMLQIFFLLINILRLSRHYCSKHCFNDIQLRLLSLVSALFSLVCLIIIIVQSNGNRLHEPLEFLESMRRHYSRVQIYTFSKDLGLIIQQIESALEVHVGASFICVLIMLILTLISLLTSVTIEIKLSSAPPSPLTSHEDEEKKSYSHKNHNNHAPIHPIPTERFIPSEQIRYTRQTKV